MNGDRSKEAEPIDRLSISPLSENDNLPNSRNSDVDEFGKSFQIIMKVVDMANAALFCGGGRERRSSRIENRGFIFYILEISVQFKRLSRKENRREGHVKERLYHSGEVRGMCVNSFTSKV